MRWDLTFTPEVSGHEQGHWGCCEGGISIQRRRENIYITKRTGEKKSQSHGKKRGKESRGRPSNSQEGNVQRWKGWDKLRRWEYSRERGGGHTQTHTRTHEIIVDLDCRDGEWVLSGAVCILHFVLHVYLHMFVSFLYCICLCVWMCISLPREASPTQQTDKYKLIWCMTLSLKCC